MRPALLLALLAAALPAQEAPAAAPAAPAAAPAAPAAVPAAPAKAEDAKPAPLAAEEIRAGFTQLGQGIGLQSPLPGMREAYAMTPEEVDAFLVGLRSAMLGQVGQPPAAPGERFDALLRERAEQRANRAKEANLAFLAKVDADKAVTKTASGLRYMVVKAGDAAAKPKATSTVTCRYHGTLADGTVFDSTRNRGDEPVTFSLAEVIPGWTEGLQLVGKGGVIKLWIPAGLAYGDQDAGPIPAGSVLAFEVEVLEVK